MTYVDGHKDTIYLIAIIINAKSIKPTGPDSVRFAGGKSAIDRGN